MKCVFALSAPDPSNSNREKE